METNTFYFTTDDPWGNPKFIKTSSDGCEIISVVFPSGPWRHAKYANPYPIGEGERLFECKKQDWENALRQVNYKPMKFAN